MFLQTKSYQNDQINKQNDQMYTLLSICLVLHPQRIDESLHSMLKEKNYAEKMNKMSAGDLSEFELSGIDNYSLSTLEQQMNKNRRLLSNQIRRTNKSFVSKRLKILSRCHLSSMPPFYLTKARFSLRLGFARGPLFGEIFMIFKKILFCAFNKGATKKALL